MKQSAVEWLENKCSEFETLDYSLPSRLYDYIEHCSQCGKTYRGL